MGKQIQKKGPEPNQKDLAELFLEALALAEKLHKATSARRKPTATEIDVRGSSRTLLVLLKGDSYRNDTPEGKLGKLTNALQYLREAEARLLAMDSSYFERSEDDFGKHHGRYGL